MKTAIIKVENQDTVQAVREVLGQLLESDFVEAVLVPRRLPSGDGFVQSLIRDPALLDECHPGDCHYQTGNFKARRRISILKRILAKLGYGEDRVWLRWISASEGNVFADTVTTMVQELKSKGPNPIQQIWTA